MALFKNKEGGGLMDVIRCDEQEYLVWKWRPSGEAGSTKRENSIRYGSSLRVKDGEVAVFVYKQKDGDMQDFIVGPLDDTIKTTNFPVLTSIVGAAWGGSSPFQAEIYFINLSGNVQIKFAIPYFDIFDPRYTDLGIPCAVRGTLTFNLTDYKNFIKLNRLIDFDLDAFRNQIKDSFIRKTKSLVMNMPIDENIPVMQIERKIDDISDIVKRKIKEDFEEDFGVNLKRFDISAIELDNEHAHYKQLKKATADQQTKFAEAKTDIEIENLGETARIQRKGMELGLEGANLAAHQINQQTKVMEKAAESLGNMGGGMSFGDGGGMNPAGMMAGMMMGGAVAGQMSGMINQMGQNIQQPINTPPPPPQMAYCISANGQTSQPYNFQQLQQLVQSGQLTRNTYVWKQGMAGWELAGNVQELSGLFGVVPPPPPPVM
jgi:membrane protease subunit (stomatin/prohibitin family)